MKPSNSQGFKLKNSFCIIFSDIFLKKSKENEKLWKISLKTKLKGKFFFLEINLRVFLPAVNLPTHSLF